MKTSLSISFGIKRDWNSGANKLLRQELDELRMEWPGTVKDESLQIKGDPLAPSIRQAIDLVRRVGKKPYVRKFPSLGLDYDGPYFNISVRRDYEKSDFGGYQHFRLFPNDELAEEEIYRLPDGTREKYIDGKKISKSLTFGFAGPNNWACKASARAELEAEGFVGLAFEEMPQKPVSKPYEPIFRLVSTLTLPPVLNPLYNEDGELCQGDFSRGCVRDNSIISGLPLYYDEAAIRAMEPFDCAWSAEAFGGVHWRNRAFIVSKRFLEYCWGRGWKCDFVPVILRPDGKAPLLEPLFPWLEE